MEKKRKDEPELLKLLNSRAAWNLPQHVDPVIDTNYRQRINAAVDAHAKAFPSDPHAANRMSLHLRRGLEMPSDVLGAANSRVRARQ